MHVAFVRQKNFFSAKKVTLTMNKSALTLKDEKECLFHFDYTLDCKEHTRFGEET